MSNVATTSRELGNYLAAFTEFAKRAPGQKQGWLRKLREDAFARFCEVGFPTTHDEDWRFTNVSPIAKESFELSRDANVTKQEVEKFGVAGLGCQLVFVNGQFSRELSAIGQLPAGVSVNSLAEEISANSTSVELHLGRYLDIQRDAFSALNTAFSEDGGYVHVRRGVVLPDPIYLLFISTASDKPLMSHPRNLIVVENEAQGTIIEDYVSIGETAAFSNTATELVAGDNATVSHYMIEREHRQAFNISTLRIQQGRSANISSHSVLLGGGLVRNNVHPVLAGEGGECLINGL